MSRFLPKSSSLILRRSGRSLNTISQLFNFMQAFIRDIILLLLLSWIWIKVLDELRISNMVSGIFIVNFLGILWNIFNTNKFIMAVLINLWLFIILVIIDVFIFKVFFIFFLLYNLISVIMRHYLLGLQSRYLKLSLLIVISHD